MSRFLRCGSRVLDLSRPCVMGVLNVTPDSFSDGGRYVTVDAAVAQARRMAGEGAAIIDVGGESTRPGASPVDEQQELDRVLPVIERIASEIDICISVDTGTPRVIVEAAAAGAHFINDVRALQRDGALTAAAQTRLPVCLMHMQGEPGSMQQAPVYTDVVVDVMRFLEQRIAVCIAAGIARDNLVVDPGFGFGKTFEHNRALLQRLEAFAQLGVPVLAGLSRKSMIGQLLADAHGPRAVEGRLHGSVAAALIAALKGAAILRVHDVSATVDALTVMSAFQESFSA